MFVLNLKAYLEGLGPRAVQLARTLESVARENGVPAAICPAAPDLLRVAPNVRIPVFAQHVDPVGPGPFTGHVTVESIAAAGASGSLVNHSEHPVTSTREVGRTVARLRALGLTAVVCAPNLQRARALAAYSPAYLAIEPPELIGGTRAVSTADPGLVARAVEAVHRVSPRTRVLCGAGIHCRDDVLRAVELGSQGVLVASAVVRARSPRAALSDLLSGF